MDKKRNPYPHFRLEKHFLESWNSKACNAMTTRNRLPAIRDIKCWNVQGLIWTDSSCKRVIKRATVFLIVLFFSHNILCTFFTGDQSGLHGGQSSTHTLFLLSHAFFFRICTAWSLRNMLSRRQHMLLWIHCVVFCINCARVWGFWYNSTP